MKKRPLEITIIGWLFILAGIAGVAYHIREIDPGNLLDPELLISLTVRLLAVLGGAFLLRGANWSRWLLLGWLSYHVILSVQHPIDQLILHSCLLAVIGTVFFLPRSRDYFRRSAPPL